MSLAKDPELERQELTIIFETWGLTAELAKQVAEQLMTHDALGTHARDEIGLTIRTRAQPLQAAFYSASTFSIGAALPLLVAGCTPGSGQILFVSISSLIFWQFSMVFLLGSTALQLFLEQVE